MNYTSKIPPGQGQDPSIEARRDGDSIVIRLPLPAQTDAVRATGALALDWGLPQTSIEELARAHGLLRRVGRHNVVVVADLVRVISEMGPRPAPTPEPTAATAPADILRGLVARTRRGAR